MRSAGTIVYVETLVYDVKQNAFVWAGQSETLNPSTAEAFVKELVDGAIKEMRKQGVIGAR